MDKPTVYILYGNDKLAARHFIAALILKMGDPGMADLNTTRLDGSRVPLEEVKTAAITIPFFSERRLVILTNPLEKLGKNAASRTRYIDLLDSLPSSTALVLVLEDEYNKRKRDWEIFNDSHWLKKWAADAGSRVHLQNTALPNPTDMPAWIRKQAKEFGGSFEPGAAVLLANQVGSNTEVASQEILKILTYLDFQRPAGVEDVQELAITIGQGDVFAMVDCIANGDSRSALRALHLLLEQQEAPSLFGMVVRQFRLLVGAREVLDEGGSTALIAAELHQPPFLAEKLARQVNRFSMADLKRIYHHLLDLDQGMKTSQITPELALDMLVVELTK